MKCCVNFSTPKPCQVDIISLLRLLIPAPVKFDHAPSKHPKFQKCPYFHILMLRLAGNEIRQNIQPESVAGKLHHRNHIP